MAFDIRHAFWLLLSVLIGTWFVPAREWRHWNFNYFTRSGIIVLHIIMTIHGADEQSTSVNIPFIDLGFWFLWISFLLILVCAETHHTVMSFSIILLVFLWNASRVIMLVSTYQWMILLSGIKIPMNDTSSICKLPGNNPATCLRQSLFSKQDNISVIYW
jgi:hypothetical protein